ncbi:SRPBCC family protein [Actinophytocola sp.]|uniref:SRPBCC family protein n=1 Tax=Actinophytocola sp. TaxID=1872138 RepID=UPI002ED90D99
MTRTDPIATGQVRIDATPAEVYRLVSDPTVMVTFAEEVRGARWRGRASAAAVGARFSGSNRNGRRRWVTICTVTEAVPGRRFAYEVETPFKVPISRWAYEIEPDGTGCRVTESSWLRLPRWFVPIAVLITGEPDRAGRNTTNIATTLSRLKAHLESR